MKQFFAGHQRQYRIAQELELLVVTDFVLALSRLLRFLFPGLGAVRDRLLDDRAPPEMVAQPLFQRRDFPFLHNVGHNRIISGQPFKPALNERLCGERSEF